MTNTVTTHPGGPEPATLAVSSRCVVVVKADGVHIQQSVYAPPLVLDAAKLELLAAIDVSITDDITDDKAEIAEKAGIDESILNQFLFGLRYSTNVVIGHKSRHATAPDHPSLGEEPGRYDLDGATLVAMRTPLALRLHRGRFELLDHDGLRIAALSSVEVASLGHLGQLTTARAAFEAQRISSGSLALDEQQFAHLLARLDSAGVLIARQATTSDGHISSAPAVLTTADHARIVTEVFDRHAAEQTERERARRQASGINRPKVIPVAFDMSTPAGLGMIIAHAKAYNGGQLDEFYDFRTDWVWSDDRLAEFTAEPAIYLFSNYLWSHQRCVAVSERIKQLSPASITIHGGPDTPKYEKDMYAYFEAHPHVDVTVRGEGEMTAAHLLETLMPVFGADQPDLSVLRDVPGISYRGAEGVHRTEDRERITDLDSLPSPFITGLFDVFADVPELFVTFETNRGCPYGCTFCDWGSATTSRIRKFSLERVYAEIEWCSGFGVESVSVADANFGILARDVDIAQRVADEHRRLGKPKAFGVSYAKNTVKHVRPIISILADAGIMTQGVLSLQTMDTETLKVIHRSNIKTDQYDQLANEMRLAHLPLMVELMMGLPGQTVESFADDLQQCIDRAVPARINITTLLVNSPMNEPDYLKEHQIVTDEPLGPGLNTAVVSTASFTRDDYTKMHLLRTDFMLYENWSVLRHIAPFVRHETGRREIDFYRAIRSLTTEHPHEWPALHAMVAFGVELMAPPHSWALVLGDLKRLLVSELGLVDGPALDAAIAAQHALLPAFGRSFPQIVALDHDVVAWAEAIMAAKAAGNLHDWDEHVPHLGEFGPGHLVVSDPDDIVGTSIGLSVDMNVIGFNWEFDSPLSRASVAATQFADWATDALLTTNNNAVADDSSVPVTLSRNPSG